MVVLVGLAAGFWHAGRRAPAAMFGGVALFPGTTVAQEMSTILPWPATAAGGCVVAVLVWHRWVRTSATVTRWSARSRRKAGVASTFDIARLASGPAMRRRARSVRPSTYGETSRWTRWSLPVAEVAVRLCRTGLVQVWSSVEDVVIVFGGPRAGKTGWLAGRVIDAPGAVLVTSTRTDLYELTRGLRTGRGPVYVFNAVGLGGLESTITFDPLTGCADPTTAVERAADLLAAANRRAVGDREFWEAQARRVLAALLHAAALGNRSMVEVQGWVANPAEAERDVLMLLRRSRDPAFSQDAAQFVSTNDRTRSSITSSIMPALGWLASPAAAAAAAPGSGFDVARLLDDQATVYLLGGEESQAAPLVCALTGHVAREARRLAADRPGGRLDPPMRLALDEAALICPVPLEKWTADMGGRGVTIVCAFQSRAQLLARYGEHDAATILNNTGAVMLFGGTRDRDDLQFWSTLTGDRDERITTTDLHGRVASKTVRRVPVLPPAQIANLPVGKVVVIRRGMAPVIGRAQMAWHRRDVRRQARARCRIEHRAARPRWWSVLALRRDERLEWLLTRLARRWPGRFGRATGRVRDANAMFRQLRDIQHGLPTTGDGIAPGGDDRPDRWGR
ncbi:type IV secretory system conjugative DNA transfer family protein [Pseudonocardia sp. C8]|nr:type IV secretory system conjugative DNA transfer family protein [Pseudonocardia sp. C8]